MCHIHHFASACLYSIEVCSKGQGYPKVKVTKWQGYVKVKLQKKHLSISKGLVICVLQMVHLQ